MRKWNAPRSVLLLSKPHMNEQVVRGPKRVIGFSTFCIRPNTRRPSVHAPFASFHFDDARSNETVSNAVWQRNYSIPIENFPVVQAWWFGDARKAELTRRAAVLRD